MPTPRCSTATAFRAHRLNACGYSLGTTYAPSWMDWPMFFHGNPVEVGPGMVFFLHMVLFDSQAGLAMTLGRTSITRAPGPLVGAPLDLVVLISRARPAATCPSHPGSTWS